MAADTSLLGAPVAFTTQNNLWPIDLALPLAIQTHSSRGGAAFAPFGPMLELVGVGDALVSGKPTEHRLAQHAHQIVATVPTRASIDQALARDGHQAERISEFATGEQACIGGDTRNLGTPA